MTFSEWKLHPIFLFGMLRSLLLPSQSTIVITDLRVVTRQLTSTDDVFKRIEYSVRSSQYVFLPSSYSSSYGAREKNVQEGTDNSDLVYYVFIR